jgi:hypothetical protein
MTRVHRKALCDTTYSPAKGQVMTYLLGYAVNYALPSIWTIAPVVEAMGCAAPVRQFDASNNLKDGWACVAVEASDKLGNKQVSRPIRICVVGQPGSTACAAATSGGADIVERLASVRRLAGTVVVTTKVAVLGAGPALPCCQGRLPLVFSHVSPVAVFSQDSPVAVAPQVWQLQVSTATTRSRPRAPREPSSF